MLLTKPLDSYGACPNCNGCDLVAFALVIILILIILALTYWHFYRGFATPADAETLGVIRVTIDVVPAGELLSDAGAYSVCVDI